MFHGKIQSLRYSAEDISFEADDVMESCDILLEQVADNDFLLATPVFRPLTATSSMLAAAPAVNLDGNNTSALYAPPHSGGGRAGMNRMRSCSLSSEQGRAPTTSRMMGSSRNRSSSILSGFSTFDLNSSAQQQQHQGVYLEQHHGHHRDDMGYIIEGEDEEDEDDEDEFLDRGAAVQFFESEFYFGQEDEEEEEEEDDNTSSLGENDHEDDMDMPNAQNTDRTPKTTKSAMRLAPQTSNAAVAAAAAAAAAQQKKKQGRPTKSDPMQIPKANSSSHKPSSTLVAHSSTAAAAAAQPKQDKKKLASSSQQSNSEKALHAPAAAAPAPPPPPPAPVSMTMEEMIAHRRSMGIDMLGIYSPDSRRRRVLRFVEKRDIRVWKKKVKYDVRKNFADSRLRVKGRFVKKGDEDLLREYMQFV